MTAYAQSIDPAAIVAFWRDAGPDKWFGKDDAFDADIRRLFLHAHEAAARGELAGWENAPESALALLILLDQFPRNIYRGSAHAFATDPMAINVCKRILQRGFDAQCGVDMKQFFYLPLMHSENISDQEYCLALCKIAGMKENVKFAVIHRDIIARFGVFPHRDKVMGRVTSPAAQAFLDAGGFAG